jgi:hypothetical protein
MRHLINAGRAGRSDDIIFEAAHVHIDGNALLRLRFCAGWLPGGVSQFVSCDRGQRYGGPECRLEARRRQRHKVNSRYQQTEPGEGVG